MSIFAEGELAVPNFVQWPNFPFGGELHVNEVVDPLPEEWTRNGDPDGPPCHCRENDPMIQPVWSNERWRVTPIKFGGQIAPFPAYMLASVDHLDLEDLDETMAAEFGTLTVKLVRIINEIESVGRTHVNRWGDLGAHLHVWFLGRPKGAMQMAGFSLPMWGFTLPGMAEEQAQANDVFVTERLSR